MNKNLEDELAKRAQQQAAVAELGQYALSDPPLYALFDQAVTLVSVILGADHCKVLELLPDGKAFLLISGVGWKDGLVGSATVDSGKQSQAGYSLLSDEPIIVEDLRTEKRFSGPQLLYDHGVISGISVLIRGKERPFGVMGVHTNSRRMFSKDDVNFFQSIANVLAEVIERKRVQDELKKHRDHLEELVAERTTELEVANKELEAFNYSVSHDLRAPLRCIDGFSQALLEDYSESLDEQGRDYLRRIRAASQRMGELIDDMLTLSRVTRSEMHCRTVDLSVLAEEIAAELKQIQVERRVEFIISKGLVAKGDPGLLRVALKNLLENAWKFSGKQPQAHIEFGHIIKEEEEIYFICDNGAGFDMNYSGKLFGPFQRLHGKEFEGTGIGLATVQRIIHRHRGRVWAEGEVNKGATFYFTLSSK